MTYCCTKNAKLYSVLENSVRDLLSTQDDLGRITTYPIENEFNGWDMWVRKYVMLGLLYFYDICKNRALQAKILKALSKHADYIVRHIGPNAAQKPLLETSAVWGGLNGVYSRTVCPALPKNLRAEIPRVFAVYCGYGILQRYESDRHLPAQERVSLPFQTHEGV